MEERTLTGFNLLSRNNDERQIERKNREWKGCVGGVEGEREKERERKNVKNTGHGPMRNDPPETGEKGGMS